MDANYANTGSKQFETGRWQLHRLPAVPAWSRRQPLSRETFNQSSGGLHSCIHQTLVITKIVKRLSMNQIVLCV